MSIVSSISFVAAIVILATCLPRGTDPFSPGRIFGFMWCFAIGLADLKFSGLQHEWSAFSWLMLGIGLGSFLAGVYVMFVLRLSDPRVSLERMRAMMTSGPTDHRLLFYVIVVAFLVYAAAYATSALVKGYVPLFTRYPSIMRTRFTVFGVGILIHLAPAIMFFVVEYLVLVRNQYSSKVFCGGIFAVTAGSYFLLLQRYDYAVWTVLTVVFLFYSSRVIRLRTFILPALVFAGLVYVIQSIRFVGHIQNYLYVVSKMKFDVAYAGWTEPYMYIVTNLENFARAVTRLDHNTFGYYTLNALMAFTGLKHWLAEYFALVETPYLNSGYNMYTFLWEFYRDFGVVGLAIFPFLLGLLFSWLYYRLRMHPIPVNVAAYGLAVFVMLMSFFNLPLALLHFVFNVAVIVFVNLAIGPRQAKGVGV